ncbi:hypothetical protein FACS189454_07340 [Planctomycetales bacterium]|nr:hypothetical protein FACS189454_07340 [Planctomycetales bacterium]
MIVLILIQRGKGGGLAGAFGGMGGQSAFGTKAGDAFTKITIVTAIIWILLCIGVLWTLKHNIFGGGSGFGSGAKPAATSTTQSAESADTTSAPVSAPTSAPVSTPAPTPTPAQPEK